MPLGEVRTHGVVREPRAVRRAVARDARVRARARAAGRASPAATRSPATRAATSCRPARCCVAGGEVAYDRDRRRRGLPRAPPTSSTPTSPTAATRAPRSAWRDGTDRGGRVRRPRRHDAGLTLVELAELMVALGCAHALNLDGGGSTALSPAAGCRTSRAGTSRCPSRAAGRIATALAFLPRPPTSVAGYVHGLVMTRSQRRRAVMGLAFFPRGGSAHVARNLARDAAAQRLGRDGRLRARCTLPGRAGRRARVLPRARRAPASTSRARSQAADPLLADPPMHPSYEDRPGAPDRVFASLDDDAATSARSTPGPRRCSRAGAARRRRPAPAPPDADPRGGRAGRARTCRSSATCTAPSC